MKPQVGQRWKYNNGNIVYVAEVIQLSLIVKMQVLEIVAGETNWTVGSIFESIELTIQGPMKRGSWEYLEGQEKS